MNPITMFTSLRPVTKIFLILALAACLITFMILAARAEVFDDLVKWLISSS